MIPSNQFFSFKRTVLPIKNVNGYFMELYCCLSLSVHTLTICFLLLIKLHFSDLLQGISVVTFWGILPHSLRAHITVSCTGDYVAISISTTDLGFHPLEAAIWKIVHMCLEQIWN